MRSFIIALLILSAIIIMIVLNTVYVSNATDELLTLCLELKNNSSAESVSRLAELWQSCRIILSLSVHQSKLEAAENALFSLSAYMDSHADFDAQLSIFTELVRKIADGQRFSFESIL